MSMRQVNELSKLYREAVYGGAKKPTPKDNRLVVTAADKKANTPAYKNFKAGHKGYKAADHLKNEDAQYGYDKKGNSLNPVDIEKKKKKDNKLAGAPNEVKEGLGALKGAGIAAGAVVAAKKIADNKKKADSSNEVKEGGTLNYNQGGLVGKAAGSAVSAKFDQLKGQGEKIQKRTKAWMDSKGQEGAPGLDAMKARTAEHQAKRGVKTKEESEYSDWRKDLEEASLIEVSNTDQEDENFGPDGKKKIDVQKNIKNKVTINPNLPEAIEEIGGEVISEKVEKKDDEKPKKWFDDDGDGEGYEDGEVDGKFDKKKKKKKDDEEDVKEAKSWLSEAALTPGTFTRKAKAADMSIQEFANHVDANPDKYSSRTKKQAYIAQAFASMRQEDVEEMFYNFIIEGYQRNPEKGEAEEIKKKKEQKGGYDAKRAARMNDPKRGINSPAFQEFMRSRGM